MDCGSAAKPRHRPSAAQTKRAPTGDAIYVGDSRLACNAHSCGTGFSREGGISGDQFRADVLASSRLKPVPQGDAISVGAVFAREPGVAMCVQVLRASRHPTVR